MRKILAWAILFALMSVSVTATESTAPLRGWYPNIGAGVRALGMGGAFTAVADDLSTALWNPAGFENVDAGKVDFMHTDLFGMGISYDYFAATCNLPVLGRSGLTLTRLDASSALAFPYNETAFYLSKAKAAQLPLIGFAQLGMNIKVLPVKFESAEFDVSALGLGFDLGILVEKGKFRFGGMLNDPYTVMRGKKAESGVLDSDINEKLVPVFSLGAAYAPDDLTVIAVDHNQGWRLGVEREVAPGIALRAGINGGSLSAGFGIKAGNIRVEYSFQQDNLGDAHRIGLGMEM